jgi:hypothetical protein
MITFLFFNLFFVLLLLSFGGTGACTQDPHLKPPYQPFFVMGIFKIVSGKLFALAGFELRSS